MIENNNIRFFVIDDLHGKRQELANIVRELAPKAELEEFEHPIYLKRWLELQREAGKELSSKPTFVISDHEMHDRVSPSTDKTNYRDIEGTLKVLQEFADYLGKVFVIGVSGSLDRDNVLENTDLKLPSARSQFSRFGHNHTDKSRIQFNATKAQAELDKFKTLLEQGL